MYIFQRIPLVFQGYSSLSSISLFVYTQPPHTIRQDKLDPSTIQGLSTPGFQNFSIIARLPLVTRINRLPRYRYIPMIVESIDKRFSFVCRGGGTEKVSVSDRTIIETLQILHFHWSLNPEGYSSARFNVPVPRVSRFRRESLPRVIEMGRWRRLIRTDSNPWFYRCHHRLAENFSPPFETYFCPF